MGHRPIPKNIWIAWLRFRGLELLRTKGDHQSWNYPEKHRKLLRPITFSSNRKEVAAFHVSTCLRTMGVDYDEFIKEIKNL